MLGKELASEAETITQRPVSHLEPVAEAGVVLDQEMVVGGGPSGDSSGHRPITALAAAYSAAMCSSERWT